MRRLLSLATIGAVLTVPAGGAAAAPVLSDVRPAASAPNYQVSTVVSGLAVPWDVSFMGVFTLFDLRGGGIYSKRGGNRPVRLVTTGGPKLFVGSEAGIEGLVVDPDGATNHRFYTCQAVADSQGKPTDLRVLRWRLYDPSHAVVEQTLIKGLPITSGRHSGCRLRFNTAKMLYVGTGDAATGTNPQNLDSLGGKVLRILSDGRTPQDNPFRSRGGNAQYVYNYGHRNVQGLTQRPGTTDMWSVEQGTDRDDEVNRVLRGGNYGYNPVPGYNESVPMTDTKKYPSAIRAAWSSGDPTIATSGATFLSGSRWGSWNGALAVGVLKGEQIKIFSISGTTAKPLAVITNLNGRHRIRTVQQGPDGALYYTTSDGSQDVIGKITPR